MEVSPRHKTSAVVKFPIEEAVMKKLLLAMMVLLAATMAFAGGTEATEPSGPVSFQLWTQEGESDGGFQFVQKLANQYMAEHPDVTIEVVQKSTENLREDFQTASLAGEAPELLWTVNDHAGPFTAAGLIQPVDGMYDAKQFVESVILDGKSWGVPITSGNHLMLLYNKSMVPTPPQTTNDLISVAKSLTKGDVYGFVYNDTEPFWLVPWLGGFGGRVFEADGVTPSLNTPAMVNTLKFLYDLEFVHKIVPAEADYGTADTLFKEGKAAMIVNGDWSLGDYRTALGANFGVAPLPVVSATGLRAAPYTAPKLFMIAEGVSGNVLAAVKSFITFATNEQNEIAIANEIARLPGRLSAQKASSIVSDPILTASAQAVAYGTPMPAVLEMRANWDAMKPEMAAVLSGSKTPAQAAADMQAAALAGIRALE
jgi:arabinogalactan oligomer/maltooligosaccharide transport system substrate-binding protein